jgi:hypothetical protein
VGDGLSVRTDEVHFLRPDFGFPAHRKEAAGERHRDAGVERRDILRRALMAERKIEESALLLFRIRDRGERDQFRIGRASRRLQFNERGVHAVHGRPGHQAYGQIPIHGQ